MTHPAPNSEPFMPTVDLPDDALVIVADGEQITWAECRRRFAFRLAAPSVERDQGSSLRDTHRATEDQWAVLEGLAKALGGIQDWRLVTDTDDAKRIGPYVVRQSVGAVAAVPRESPITSGALAYMAFIAAANPATVLKLIEAARASQVGMEREARNDPDIIEQARGILADPKPDVAGAREAPTMDDRIGTHSSDCWSFGPRHYDCAARRVAELEAKLAAAEYGFDWVIAKGSCPIASGTARQTLKFMREIS